MLQVRDIFFRKKLLLFLSLALSPGLGFTGATAWAGSDTLRALTFNAGLLRFLNYSIVPMVNGRTQALPSVLAQEAQSEQLDLIALEEVWEDRIATRIREALEPLGYKVVRPTRKIVLGSGLLFAVRAPWTLEESEFRQFNQKTSAEVVVNKGFILARLRSPSGTTVLVAHTHMQAIQFDRRGNAVRQSEVKVHRNQAQQIEAALSVEAARVAPPGVDPTRIPRILMGDLNAGPDAGLPSYILLIDQYGWRPPENVLLRTWDPINPLVHFSRVSNQNPAMIDHCLIKDAGWTSGRIRLTLTDPIPGLLLNGRSVPPSDHFGLLCELELDSSF